MDEKNVLTKLELSKSESEVYLILLRLKEATIYQIADETKISRPNIYDTVKKLVNKNLITPLLKGKKTYFRANSPSLLSNFLEIKKNELENLKNELENILPNLNKIYETSAEKPRIELLEGAEGIKAIMNDFIKVNKNIWIFNSVDDKYLKKRLPEFFLKKFINEKEKLGIKTNVLYNKEIHPFKGTNYHFKQLPKSILSCVGYWVYGDNVAIGIWMENPIIIKITNKDVAETYLHSIKLIWYSIKK